MRDSPIARQGNLSGQAWEALAKAAKALLDLANAAVGKNVLGPDAASLSLPSPSYLTVGETINDFLIAKAKADRSDRYLRALKNSLSKFAKGRSRQPLSAVTTEQIETWLAESGWAPRTQKGYLMDVRTLYNFAVRRGYCQSNPANAVEVATQEQTPIGVHTPEQVSIVMETARRSDLNTMRCLAIRYFAGLRASEAEALDETEIRTDEGLIEVTAGKSKTRRRRLVEIQPNLSAWLALGGALPLRDVSNRMRLMVKATGVPWPHNAPRHSFCSYHLAKFESAAKTALQAGHTEQMLFQNYRAVVSKKEAERFWSIVPRDAAGVTVPGPVTAGRVTVTVTHRGCASTGPSQPRRVTKKRPRPVRFNAAGPDRHVL